MKILKYFIGLMILLIISISVLTYAFQVDDKPNSEKAEIISDQLKNIPTYTQTLKGEMDSPSIEMAIFKLLGFILVVIVFIKYAKSHGLLQRIFKDGGRDE